MTDRISWTSSAPSTQFVLEADRIGQNAGGNYTTVRIRVKAINRGSTGSFSNAYGEQIASIDGIWGGDGHRGNPFLPSGVGNGAERWNDVFDINIGHDGNGNRGGVTLRMRLNYDNGTTWEGTADFNDFPRIPKPANPPYDLRLEPGTQLPLSFGVRYERGATNGADITADQAQWSTTADFSNIIWTDGNGSPGNGPYGLTNPRGNAAGDGPGPALQPGTTYYVRIRSDAYGYGWSGWSATFSAKTLGPVRLKVGGIWKFAIPYVKVNGVWKMALPFVKSGGTWKRTG